MVKVRIKKGDTVRVIAGKDKGKNGKILKVFPKTSRVLVSGVNLIKKHLKPTADREGGVIAQESPIHISNVSYVDVSSDQVSKIGYKIEDSKKVRFARKTGVVLSELERG